MPKVIDLLKEGRTEDVWKMCCGFIDLSMDEFMNIQNRLLLEQIQLLGNCELGRRLMNGNIPDTVEEFRQITPMTTYADYSDDLNEKREDILPVKPDFWMQTSGRSGEYPYKWVPINKRLWEEAGKNFCAIGLFSCCNQKGEVRIRPGDKLLNAAAHTPYLTGNIAYKLVEEFGLEFLPPILESSSMDFEERIDKGLKLALSEGMTGFYGLAGVLVAIGEKFKNQTGNTNISSLLSQPRLLSRLVQGKLLSKIAGRAMLPKDLWSLKLIVSMGTDCSIYREKINELWGRIPLEVYGNTESIVLATQTWDYNGMVFFPNLNFLEFVPEKEYVKWQLDRDYQPKTVLLDEVKAGENYELVITNFHGGAMVRYRIGDMIRINELKNDRLSIQLPQITFERRADDLIDLGFMRLTERVIWQAIEKTGISYKEWTAHKEIGENAQLRLYMELSGGNHISEEELGEKIYEQIKCLDDGIYVYEDLTSLEKLIDFRPIQVILLPEGAFSDYKRVSVAEGKGLAHLKPPHINPSEKTLSLLGVRKTSTVSDN
ncbi:GH3 auxin-responsive promoter family protein [Chloroflexota bacterium]